MSLRRFPGDSAASRKIVWAKHCAQFVVLFLAGTVAHYFTRPLVGPILNVLLNAKVAARLINVFTPSENVRAVGSTVGSVNTYIQVAQGCEGFDLVLMLSAAVIVFPLPMRRKLQGLLLGTLLMYSLNLTRLVGLWYCLRYFPSSIDTMHMIVGQTLMIVAGVAFFVAWTGVFRGIRA